MCNIISKCMVGYDRILKEKHECLDWGYCQLAVKRQQKWLPWENFESQRQSLPSSGPASRSLPWPLHQNMFRRVASPSKSVTKLIQSIFKYCNFIKFKNSYCTRGAKNAQWRDVWAAEALQFSMQYCCTKNRYM